MVKVLLAIIPHVTFQDRSGYWNFAPLMCAPNEGKNIATRGSCMSFDACESRILIHSVPFSRFGIAGAVALIVSYLIDYLLFRWITNDRVFQLFQFQFAFFDTQILLILYITIYISISYIIYKKRLHPQFINWNWNNWNSWNNRNTLPLNSNLNNS